MLTTKYESFDWGMAWSALPEVFTLYRGPKNDTLFIIMITLATVDQFP